MDLATPVGKLSMVGPIFKRRLEKLVIETVGDFLFHFPSRYEDLSLISTVANIKEGQTVTVRGRVVSLKNEFTWNRRFIQKCTIEDETGTVEVVWFNQTYLIKLLPKGTLVSLAGKVETFRKKLTFIAPAYEIVGEGKTIHTGRLVPIYPETYGISSKWLRTKIYALLMLCKTELREYLPKDVLVKEGLMPYGEAV